MSNTQRLRFKDMLKNAGLRSLGKYLLTGRSTLYHGTSGARARSILEKGLRPNAQPGISERVKNILGVDPRGKTPGVFASRSKPRAKSYGVQQELLNKGLPSGAESISKLQEAASTGDLRTIAKGLIAHAKTQGRQLYHTPGALLRQKTLKASVPAHRTPMAPNPEIKMVPDAGMDANLKALSRIQKRPVFYRDVKLPNIPPKYIQGSPKYERVSLEEIKKHLGRMRQQPRKSAREALRNLYEAQTAPVSLDDILTLIRNR
jgi:hypothetical protein